MGYEQKNKKIDSRLKLCAKRLKRSPFLAHKAPRWFIRLAGISISYSSDLSKLFLDKIAQAPGGSVGPKNETIAVSGRAQVLPIE
jgi:hypothetical protein